MTVENGTGGDLLVKALHGQGVDRIFGIPGIQLDGATDALQRANGLIDFTATRHEQATTYMADGYARSSGREGVAMVVPGPGVLNALSGIATAYATNSPVLLLAGQIASGSIGKGLGALHELPDQTGILERLTKWSARPRSAEEIPALVAEAFRQMRSGRPGPVSLELPPDILASTGAAEIPGMAVGSPVAPDQSDISRAAELIRSAEFPVIYVGGGVIAASAGDALRELAEALGAPVVMSENARGALDARHALAFDAVALRALRSRADLVLAVGTRFVTTFGSQIRTDGAKVVLMNAEPSHLGGPRQAVHTVLSDARLGLEALLAEIGTGSHVNRQVELQAVRTWVDEQFTAIRPQREWLGAIRNALPDDGVLVSEFTQIGYAASVSYPTYQPRTYIGPGYQGTLGYGFATALGVQSADPSRAVVSVNGDGGFAWTMQELSTAKKYNLGLVTIVFNDGFFGNVRLIQKNDYEGRYFATDLVNPDYPMLARAFGIATATVRSAEELAAVLPGAIAAREPILIEAVVGEFPSPWGLIHEFPPA
jgi:acetolactate synthase-1/2/3 large subunit